MRKLLILITLCLPVVVWAQDMRKITGRVLEAASGEPLPGATVFIDPDAPEAKEYNPAGTVTDVSGKFELTLPASIRYVVVSFIGYEALKADISGKTEFTFRLKEEVSQLDEVVVTGYQQIEKRKVTSAITTVQADDIKSIGVASIDQMLEGQVAGLMSTPTNGAPGAPAKMRIRSTVSLSGSTDPLWVLDGMILEGNDIPKDFGDKDNIDELQNTSIGGVNPADIESITILKDAAATAIYGAKAANGVIVITTRAPKPGEVTISYNLTGSLSLPDLSDYNLANAREKLEIEKAAGIYEPENGYYANRADAIRAYNERLVNVQKGVNTDWLSLPLRNAVNHKHSLSIEGGNVDLRYNLELGYTNENGVMKGSYRDNVDVGFTVDWRLKDKLQVLNKISYNFTDAPDSPYGSFSDYAHLQPYDRLYDDDGILVQALKFSQERGGGKSLNNPFYEAKLNNYNWNKQDEIIEQFMFQWFINDYLTLKGQLALTKTMGRTERFIDPKSSNATARTANSSTSANSSLLGDLYRTDSDATKWDTQFSLYYSRSLGLHNLNISAIVNAQSTKSESTSAHYRGFPSGAFHSPNYAAEIYQKPAKSESLKRLMGFLLSANYTWNDVYLADLSVRFDGSSEFGSDQKWAPFWSTGVGLNIHNYGFLKDNDMINQLKVRVSYGQTGKVNFPSYSAKTVYATNDRWYATGFGTQLKALGNHNLKWETTNKLNIGTDLQFWDERVSLNFDYYYNKTVDLITDVSLPASAGFTSYKDNLGETLNKGFDIQVRFDVYKDKDWNVSLWGNLNHNRNEILKISDALRAYNERVNEKYAAAEDAQGNANLSKYGTEYSEPEMKYEEGASLTSIFAVRSLGIDPMTGNELFLYRDGSVSSLWKATETVRVGDEEPKASGSFGVNLTYKNLTLFASFAYDWGKQTYNQTLVDGVENADIENSNVDRRVLTQRWQKPGDIAPLRNIKDMNTSTMPTSRFVQDDNELSLSALTLSYDFNTDWLKKIRLKMLRLELSTNDLFRASTVRLERGTSYPFARTFNFSLRATF